MKILAATAALFAVSGAYAGVPADPVAQSGTGGDKAVAEEGPNKIICKRERVSGSRLAAKKVCQTAAEWERQRREDQQAAEKVQTGRWKSN